METARQTVLPRATARLVLVVPEIPTTSPPEAARSAYWWPTERLLVIHPPTRVLLKLWVPTHLEASAVVTDLQKSVFYTYQRSPSSSLVQREVARVPMDFVPARNKSYPKLKNP